MSGTGECSLQRRRCRGPGPGIVLTSNKSYGERDGGSADEARGAGPRDLWGSGARGGDPGPTAPPLDDDQHPGESYRLKERKKAGLLPAEEKAEKTA